MKNYPFQRLQSELAILISHTPAGERLPSEPDLARQLGVSRATLREAMRTFEAQGLIRRRQGAGTFVVGQISVMDAGLETLESLDTMARRLNLEVTVQHLSVEQLYADKDFAEKLGVSLATRLTRISRVIDMRRPIAYLVDTLPEEVLHKNELPPDFSGSVLDFLIARGDSLSGSRTEVSATVAASNVARHLEIQRGDVLLKFTSKLFTLNGKVVDYSVSNFIPGYFNFHINRRVDVNKQP